MARCLVDLGASVNTADTRGLTPLFLSCHMGRRDIVVFLSASGGSRSILPAGVGSLEEVADDNDHDDVAALLRSTRGWDELCYVHEIESLFGPDSAKDWTTRMLRQGKRLDAAVPIARLHAASFMSSELVLAAHSCWSSKNHDLFPQKARCQAARLLIDCSLLLKHCDLPQVIRPTLMSFLVTR